MPQTKPQLSIIIVSYNTASILKVCLQSTLVSIQNLDYEIIVVDNASSDNSIMMLNRDFPKVKVIKNQKNIGFGAANNQGIKEAQGKWVLLLNSDVRLQSGFTDWFLKSRRDKQLYGCKLLNSDGSIQSSAGYFPTLERVARQMLFIDDLPVFKNLFTPYQQANLQFYLHSHSVDWVTGAFMLFKKSDFNQTSGFDERIFMYGEEVELCNQLKNKGIKVMYDNAYSVYHDKGGSTLNGFKAAIIGEYQGLVFFYKKYYPHQVIALKMLLFIGALLRVGVFGIIMSPKKAVYVQALSVINQMR